MKSKSFVLMILSAGFGLIAAVGISQVMGKNQAPEAPQIEMAPVVVSIDHLDHKALLTEENCRVENWPREIVPENAVRSLDDIKDRAITTRLSKGLPILLSDIIHKNEVNDIQIPPGFKVVAIKVSGDDTIAGLLGPGDKVDVIGLFKRQRNGQTQTVSRTFLKGLQVFSVNSRMRANTGTREDTGNSGSAIVGVLVNEKQSEDIVFVQKTGQIKLVMRGDDVTEEELAETESVLANAFDDYSGDDEDADDQPKVKQVFESMIVWRGGSYEKVTFDPNQRPRQAFSDEPMHEPEMPREAISGDLDAPEEIDSDYEEDQYPGE